MLDTTSHNYEWSIDTMGVFQSALSGVWGSSPTNVYAVGRIARSDSVDYNITRFDGQSWKPFYIPFGAPPAVGSPQLFGIHGFSFNDIWVVGVGGVVSHWNGASWTTISLGTCSDPQCLGVINRDPLFAVWGTSSNDLFAVGDSGVIVHYDGQNWTKMQSGTTLTFRDVWGSASNDVYAVAMDFFSAQWKVVHYNGSIWEAVFVDSVQLNRPGGLWGSSSANVYMVGDFVGRYDGQFWKRIVVPNTQYTMHGVEGSGANNIFVAGSFGVVLHWNGDSWKLYDELLAQGGGRLLERIWTNGQNVFIVGSTQTQGIAIRGIVK